jgi:Na+-transporting NADH:ubiquinone oxidoreductase subunit C
MQRNSALYTLVFAAAVCAVCSLLVTGAAVVLKSRQVENKLLDKQRRVLYVAGLSEKGEKLPKPRVDELFQEFIKIRLVDMDEGEFVEPEQAGVQSAVRYDPRTVLSDPQASVKAPANPAKVMRVPDYGKVYEVRSEEGGVRMYVFPVHGKGLWSTMWGFLALDKDLRTVEGLTFYEQGETPGLGGEVESKRFEEQWPGRLAFNEDWNVEVEVIKGDAGPPEEDPYQVDGLSGATITSRGVTHLIHFWLGENGYKPLIMNLRDEEA